MSDPVSSPLKASQSESPTALRAMAANMISMAKAIGDEPTALRLRTIAQRHLRDAAANDDIATGADGASR